MIRHVELLVEPQKSFQLQGNDQEPLVEVLQPVDSSGQLHLLLEIGRAGLQLVRCDVQVPARERSQMDHYLLK